MAEYIKREDCIQVVEKYFTDILKLNPDICIDGIRSLPAADVIERKKGKWELSPDDSEGACTICNYKIYGKEYRGRYLIVPYNFCPNCGADLRGEDNGKV